MNWQNKLPKKWRVPVLELGSNLLGAPSFLLGYGIWAYHEIGPIHENLKNCVQVFVDFIQDKDPFELPLL